MKLNKTFIGLFLSIGLISCHSDGNLIEDEQALKSYELVSIQWKLDPTDGQSIVEEKIPAYNFRNDADTTMEIVIEPLKDWQGSSTFKFNDSLAFTKLNYKEVSVSITEEFSLFSERYSYLIGEVDVPLKQEESFFPLSDYVELSLMLNPRSTLTTNYTLFFKKNKASFLATFREHTTNEFLELKGTWTGLFFNNLIGESVVDEID